MKVSIAGQILRQVIDLQRQADRIIAGDDDVEMIISFAKFAQELKYQIEQNIQNVDVRSLLVEIPHINYADFEYKWWHDFVFPFRWKLFYKKIIAKRDAADKITLIRSKFASIEFLLREKCVDGGVATYPR